MTDPVEYRELASWGFWDETWSNFHGGYGTEEEARTGLDKYASWLEGFMTDFPKAVRATVSNIKLPLERHD